MLLLRSALQRALLCIKKGSKYLCWSLYNSQSQILRHHEGGGGPGRDAVRYSQRYVLCVGITGKKGKNV